MENTSALKNLMYRMADDALIIGHRHAEWTGLGPTLEEDIAFSSIAQDKLGHALALYTLLQQLGERDPDTLAFTRDEKDMKCCHLVEMPNNDDYAFSLVRHFLFDTAEKLRYGMLENSSYQPLAQLARKVKGEIKYHVFHANTWVIQLSAAGTDESKARMQEALNEAYPLAFGIFEDSGSEQELIDNRIFVGEHTLQETWLQEVSVVLEKAGLSIPNVTDTSSATGGRKGYHTDHLQPLINEMTEVFRIDPTATW